MWKWISRLVVAFHLKEDSARPALPDGYKRVPDEEGKPQLVYEPPRPEDMENLEVEKLAQRLLLLRHFDADITVDHNHFDDTPEDIAMGIRNCWWLPSSGHPNQSQAAHWQRPVKLHQENLMISGGGYDADDAWEDIDVWLRRIGWQASHSVRCQQVTSSQPLEDGFFSCIRILPVEAEVAPDSELHWVDSECGSTTNDCLVEFVSTELERIGGRNCEKFLQNHYGTFGKDEAVHPVFQLLDYPHFDMGIVNITFSGSLWPNNELRFWSRPTYFHK